MTGKDGTVSKWQVNTNTRYEIVTRKESIVTCVAIYDDDFTKQASNSDSKSQH